MTRAGTLCVVEHLYTHRYTSPVGDLWIAVDRTGAVHRIAWNDFRPELPSESWERNKYACGEVEFQLDEYFAGTRLHFSVNAVYDGTTFQRAVWTRIRKIGYGDTMSYGELAQKIGRRDAAQAVGNAVGLNPIVIIIPCHRIVTASGALGGYARRQIDEERGAAIKRHLLALERAR